MTCLLDFPPTSVPDPVALRPAVLARATAAGPTAPSATPTPSTTTNPTVGPAAFAAPLVRFVTDGLAATVESYRAGQLPLARLVWELTRRLDQFEGLPVANRAVTRMRWITQSLAALAAELTEAGRPLTAEEQTTLRASLLTLSDALGALLPPAPTDPSGAAHPAAPQAVA